MKNAIIIYHSKTGTTCKFGNEMALYCKEKGINTRIISTEEYAKHDLDNMDYLFLGTWTKGLMFFAQHPDKQWKYFIQSISIPENCKIILFTTFKIAVGSMFTKMRSQIQKSKHNIILELKSKNGKLSDYILDLLGNYITAVF